MFKKEDGTMILGYKNGHMTESEIREATPAYKERFTYDDYMSWDDDIRWELIDGIPYMMGAPNNNHQDIAENLFGYLWTFLKGKRCKVRIAPSDVRLNPDLLDDSVVQPDIYIYCDPSKKDKTGIKGAPDMVVEILSPSTAKYDKTTKFEAYRKAGVRELWIIDPETKSLAVNLLSEGNYITHPYTKDDTVPVHILEGCSVNLIEIFDE